MKYILILFTFCLSSLLFGSELSFEKAIVEIKLRSTDLPVSKADLEAADHKHLASRLSFLPALAVGYTKGKTYESPSQSDSLFIKASMNLFNGGSDYSKLKANSYNLLAKKEKLKSDELLVEKKATQAIVDVLIKSFNKHIYLQFKSAKEQSLKTTQLKFKRGLIPKQEVLKSQVDLSLAKASFKTKKIEEAKAKATLQTLLGHSNIKPDWPLREKLKQLNLITLKQEIFSSEKRPDLTEAGFNLSRDQHFLKSSKRAFLPKLDLSYKLSKDSLNSLETDERTLLFTLSLPLFSNWQTYSSFKSTQAVLLSTQYKYEFLKRDANGKWESIKESLAESIHTALEREQNLKISRQLYRDNFKRFKAGKVSVNDLQLDQNRLLDSESQAAAGWASAHLAYLDYCHSKGYSVLNCD